MPKEVAQNAVLHLIGVSLDNLLQPPKGLVLISTVTFCVQLVLQGFRYDGLGELTEKELKGAGNQSHVRGFFQHVIIVTIDGHSKLLHFGGVAYTKLVVLPGRNRLSVITGSAGTPWPMVMKLCMRNLPLIIDMEDFYEKKFHEIEKEKLWWFFFFFEKAQKFVKSNKNFTIFFAIYNLSPRFSINSVLLPGMRYKPSVSIMVSTFLILLTTNSGTPVTSS